MEIKTQPFTLKIIDININNCPSCSLKLIKKKTTRKEKIKTCLKCNWSECGYCSYFHHVHRGAGGDNTYVYVCLCDVMCNALR